MDQLSDPSLKLKYNKSKLKVKLWESEFKTETGNKPSKDDIKDAPSEIREAYKWYWQIKIHALGQDSLLDATFVDKGINDAPSNSNNVSPVSSSVVETPTPPSSITCATNGEEESSTSHQKLQDDTLPKPTNIQVMELVKQETASSSAEKSVNVPEKVWGSHLNRHKSSDIVSKTRSLNRSSSFHLSEKLFVGSKFKKRNPRKSLSFSNGRLKDRSSFGSTDSFQVPSDSSFSLDSTQGFEDGFPITDLPSDVSFEPDAKTDHYNFVIKKNIVSNVQPVSAVQKIMDGSKPKIERCLDKGWLERVMQVDDLLTQEMTDSTKLPQPINYTNGKAKTAVSEESDEDFIYGSDNESLSPRKAAKEEKARLALCSTSINKSVIQDCKNDVKPPNFQELEVNIKKRKLDAIEAAMAVLSERRKQAPPNKRIKKSDPIRQENQVDGNSEVDENSTAPCNSLPDQKTSSKSKMSKKEVLEKKVASGTVNENFVRINMKKKVFVRGKKTMNFQKYKKQQWKNKKKELSDEACAFMSRMDPSDSAAGGGLQKCFKCGDVGHFARKCLKMKGDTLMPNEEEVEESPFPSLEDVERMAKEKIGQIHYRPLPKSFSVGSSVLNEEIKASNHVNTSASFEEIRDSESQQELPISIDYEVTDDLKSIMSEPAQEPRINFASVGSLYPLREGGTVIATPSEVYDCLHKFGHTAFRPGQEEVIMRILSGLSTLVTLSTGSGKSLCYQLPAYMFAVKKNCITLVISPLVSLMDDQISGLPSFIHGAALHTAQTEKQREKVMDLAKSGKLHFLLVSPEAVVAGEKKTGFGSLLRSLPDIAFACIDEAHCVSQWSHNFRPSYLVLFKILREKLGVRTVLGLTATATQTAVTSIIEHMGIPDGRKGVIKDVPLPNNLLLTVSMDSHRDLALVKLLSTSKFQSYKSIIVYCTRREECERLAALLRTCLKDSSVVPTEKRKLSTISEAYHAGLSSARRKQVQSAFMSGNLRIVIATVAFGMGINKADIRSVVHFNMPSKFESYVQEVGRAGRDGDVSHCHLFLNSEGKDMNELRRHIFADSVDRHTIRKLLQRVFVPCKCRQTIIDSNEKSDSSLNKGEQENSSMREAKKVEPALAVEDMLVDCVGHEVAFSVEETVSALDLPEENITTLLCYLELHDKTLLQVLPKAYTHCKVQSYKGIKHIRDVARSCPPLAMAIAMDLMSGDSHKTNQVIEFPVIEIASAIGWDSGVVKRELMNLEWNTVNGQPRRSGIKVELSNLGFRVKAPGNLAPEKLDAALDFLHERVVKQEQASLAQLQEIFCAVTRVAYPDVSSLIESPDQETRSNSLKDTVRTYFQEDRNLTITMKAEEKLENGDQIANDTRQLVHMYRDCSFTGRAVARIFHGISSPNFPAQVWGRCRFWRAHLDSDFKLICLLATRVLLKMR